jgi:hypothetical protein
VPFLRAFSTVWPSPEAPGADLVVLPHGKIYGKSWKLMKHALKYWEIYSNVIVLVDFPPYSDFPICNDVIFSEGGSTKQIQVLFFSARQVDLRNIFGFVQSWCFHQRGKNNNNSNSSCVPAHT